MVAREAVVREQITALVEGTACAGLSTEFALNDSIATLSGPIASETAFEALKDAIVDIDGIEAIREEDVVIAGDAFCDVLTVLRAASITPQSAYRGAASYTQGQRVDFEYPVPAFPTYLIADYISDGQVYHLVQSPASTATPLAPGSRFTIGGEESEQLFIYPPFGTDIIVTLASSEPVFEKPRLLREPAEPYFAELSNRLRAGNRRLIDFRFILIHTSAGTGFSSGLN